MSNNYAIFKNYAKQFPPEKPNRPSFNDINAWEQDELRDEAYQNKESASLPLKKKQNCFDSGQESGKIV
jgi:hypothetical protein